MLHTALVHKTVGYPISSMYSVLPHFHRITLIYVQYFAEPHEARLGKGLGELGMIIHLLTYT